MSYLYLITALFLTHFGLCSSANWQSNLFLKLPAYSLAIVFSILAMQGFGVI